MNTETEKTLHELKEELDAWLIERGLRITSCGCCGGATLDRTGDASESIDNLGAPPQ